MEKWTEKDFLSHNRWFHATSARFFDSIIHQGIIANINRDTELDFGYGFYLAANPKWAEKYAKGFEDARIIEFHFRPIDILQGNPNYKFFGALNEEFADFVFSNRMFIATSERECAHDYDLVAGVMSDGSQVVDFEEFRDKEISKSELYRRLLLPREDWQIAIHSQELCNHIFPFRAYDLKGGEYDVSNYHQTI